MSFLYPQFLYGLFALSIPIIIHLFNFRKTKRVYFSNTRFLKKVKEASSSKRKLKHYLILTSRLLMIFFLVMAFAQPFLPTKENTTASSKTLIYLDNSLSMSNETDEDITAFDAALGYINALTTLYPSSSEYKILTNDFNSFSNVFKNRNDLVDLTTEMRLTGITRTYDEIINRLEFNREEGEQYDLYWISDFQASTSGVREGEVALDSAWNVNLIPINFTSVNNVFVDSLYLDNPFLIGDKKLKLNVVIRNVGNQPVDDLIIKVFVDEVQSATASMDLRANQAATATFDLAFNLEGNNKCRISFEEFPVTFDNDFHFTINGSQRISILEIKGKSVNTPVQNVFGNEGLFDLQSVVFSNLDYNLIPASDLVVINGLETLDPSLAVVLNKYLQNYGDIIFIPATKPDIASYRQLSGLGGLMVSDSSLKSDLATPDFDDPFFENVFEETGQNFSMPEAAGVIEWGRDRTALLKYKSGMPFLSKITSNGNIFLMGAPLNSAYTNFYSHAIFVPVMYRIAVESASRDSKLYYYTDDATITFRADTIIADNVFKLRNDEQEIIPTQRIIGNDVVMEVPKFVIGAGFYDLMFKEGKITTLAFNYTPEESDLRQYSPEEIRRIFKGKVDIFEVGDKDQFERAVEKKYIGQPLWKYAIILALIFLLVEVLLIRFLP
ncbi:Hypothetical protein C900_05597 [Fulvivirga imtechensis AK7]|uniref:Aerotolerance regulator N-terminal domain-containing protein n=1 Tax=Fulvivirga imtechensis AK7 TaxID=1237149 RepID=L8JN05_9BACT|nr:BatA domain-containing protein [Fulvivirga imtechensis]ELR68904.1 Hypothetical protein C900_05597 [Fulvivirga imtechensis AK7]